MLSGFSESVPRRLNSARLRILIQMSGTFCSMLYRGAYVTCRKRTTSSGWLSSTLRWPHRANASVFQARPGIFYESSFVETTEASQSI